jgi:outer membrane protein assembly factor BamB
MRGHRRPCTVSSRSADVVEAEVQPAWYSAATGTKVWSYHTGAQVVSSPTVANGGVYFGSADDNVYAFGL